MAYNPSKKIGTTEYLNTHIYTSNGGRTVWYQASKIVKGKTIRANSNESAKAAALTLDKALIKIGQPPINILKRKI